MRSIEALKAAFRARFGVEPRIFQAPGRVNLIGEHTDYNDGFVLPFALGLVTRVAVAPRCDRQVNVYAAGFDELRSFSLDSAAPPPRGIWLDYVEGVARQLETIGVGLTGADLWIEGDVPLGAGLSSSASLELSAGLALLSTVGKALQPSELAKVGQAAEHRYVGTQCGIMDQLVSELGQAGSALLIDCRSLETRKISLELSDAVCVICDTQVRHTLASSEYNLRRQQCEAGVAVMRDADSNIRALRDVSMIQLESARGLLSEVVWRRCRHVISENERTLAAAQALERGDLVTMGQLMQASHQSLRDDYEVSCPELDLAVATASSVPGVHGSRMTGGGFGGSTITLLAGAALSGLEQRLFAAFAEAGWKPPILRAARASRGIVEL